MSDTALKDRITDAMKDAMRAKDKDRLGAIRLITAAIKQKEVDERADMDDTAVLAVLDKMLKQRRDSIKQYNDAGRDELAAKEEYEVGIIQEFMPAQLSEDEIAAIIDDAISKSGAETMKDMGKVMGIVRPQVQGRADMGALSGVIKSRLS
jgi:uncharacterized protein YqeY